MTKVVATSSRKTCQRCSKRAPMEEFIGRTDRKTSMFSYCRDCRRTMNAEKQRRITKAIKQKIFDFCDNKCARCGFDDPRVFQIDHVGGGGRAHRAGRNPPTFYREVLASLLRGEKKFQILCANCNWIKRVEEDDLS